MSSGVKTRRLYQGVTSPLAKGPENGGHANAVSLEKELDWFNQVLETRFKLYFEGETPCQDVREITPPDLNEKSEYARLVRSYDMTFDERLVLILSLIPHVRPQSLDLLFIQNKNLDRPYTEFGGWQGKIHTGFLPTCETVSFILAGRDLNRRFELFRLLDPEHFFVRDGILSIEQTRGEPLFSSALRISSEYLHRLTSGVSHKPDFSLEFPAKLLTTQLTWEDLVLGPQALEEVGNITTWLKHSRTIMDDWGLGRSIKPGYRSLFHGPPGTGKTLTATLIGAETESSVYRIDLSAMVSKYIGETEKNLASVFDEAEHKNWILFFDEAEALFGKRTQTSSSHDRYANQEVSYLLQRIEDFPQVVILATNLKGNIDDAFARRFQSAVYFPMPDAEQRLRLWEGMLRHVRVEWCGIDPKNLAENHELSGGAIANVIRYGAIRAMQRDQHVITLEDITRGIARERMKEGKTT